MPADPLRAQLVEALAALVLRDLDEHPELDLVAAGDDKGDPDD